MIKYSEERNHLIQPFISYRQASDRWNEYNGKIIMYFDRYCGEISPGSRIITQDMIEGWCSRRSTETALSRYTRTNIVVQFVRYLISRGYTDICDPQIHNPHNERNYVPHAFSINELKRFFAKCDERAIKAQGSPKEARSLIPSALYRLLYSSGMRTIEVRLLRCDHIDLDSGVINVEYTKGREQHYVVLHDSTLELLRSYNTAIGRLILKRGYFFPRDQHKPLYREWIPETFRTIWDSVNDSHAVPYDLRHNFATTNINKWVDQGFGFTDKFIYLSKSMGHSKLESTKYYYSLVPGLSKVIDEQTRAGFDALLPEVDYE